ncbi:MAG: hypothetical protein IJ189_12265 [Clostridia bacterium]|nr:hypothetical protein [Clostridia bacterium]
MGHSGDDVFQSLGAGGVDFGQVIVRLSIACVARSKDSQGGPEEKQPSGGSELCKIFLEKQGFRLIFDEFEKMGISMFR